MEVLEAVRKRCAVREFKHEIITDKELGKILEAARWAPSPFNSQPWEFIIIKDKETLREISRFARFAGYLEAAPMAIAVVVSPINKKFSWIENKHETKFAAAMAVQNMMLAAWEMGIGSCWVSVERAKVKKILDVPENHFLLTIVPLGYPEKIPPEHDESFRKKTEDMTFYEKYGEKGS